VRKKSKNNEKNPAFMKKQVVKKPWVVPETGLVLSAE
jgi:hypothetical protein